MRRITGQKADHKLSVMKSAALAAIFFILPAQSFALHINVPAARAALQKEHTLRASGSGQRQIIVSLPDRQLALLEDGKILKTYPVAVGADISRSPEGDFTVINRLENPTYYATGKVIGPGKANPLGTRWMGLSRKGYGIHGTNVPSSIGQAASHGCIRMKQRDLEELFQLVSVGDKVMFRDAQMTALLAPLQAQPNDGQVLVAVNGDAVTNATPAVVDSEDKF